MKRICYFLLCATLLCLFGCNKTDDGTVKAKFSFVVKEMNFSDDPPEYELKVGDKIDINIKGYDSEKYMEQVKRMQIPTTEFELNTNLIYNGSGWDLVQNGGIVQELEITGNDKQFIIIECRFTNPLNGLRRSAKREIHFNDCPESQVIELTFYRWG